MSDGIQIVGTFEYQDGKFVTVDKNRKDYNSHRPVPIPANQIKNYYPIQTQSTTTVGTLINQVRFKAGEVYEVPGGRRIIVEATSERIIFVEIKGNRFLPGFFIQTPKGFHSQWLDVVRKAAASKLATVTTLAEWEVQFLVGVVAGSGWGGLAIVVGVDLFEESITRKKTKATKDAIRTLQVLVAFRRELNLVAPVLTSVLCDFVWLTLLKGQAKLLGPTMAGDPKVASRAAGTIAAQLGKKALDQRLTVSSIIWTVLSQLGIKGALTVPATLSNTIDLLKSTDPESVLKNIESALSTMDIVLSQEERQLILKELEANPIKIASIFKKMIEGLKLPPQ